MKAPTVMLALSTMFTLLAVALVAVSFATDHWQNIIVNRSEIKKTAVTEAVYNTNPLYFTRYRGLFRTCYPGNETTWLDTAEHRVDGWCISEQGYQLDRDPDTLSYGTHYDMRIQLLRSHFGLLVVSMLMLLLAAILTGIGCWTLRPGTVKAAGVVVAIGAFFAAGGVAFFHGYEYLENNKIDTPAALFNAFLKDSPAYSDLWDNMRTEYGYSYYLAWVGVASAFIAAILSLCTGFTISQAKRDEERKALAKDNYTLSNSGIAPRNKAYEYAENPQNYPYDDYAAAQYAASGYPTSAGYYPQYGYDNSGYPTRY